MKIIDSLLTLGKEHGRTGDKLTPKGICIHYVGNPGSSALGNRNYFESGSGGNYVSAHYIIGLEGEILRCVPEAERAQHAGKSYGEKWNEIAKTNNSTLIGIENCHPDAAGKFNEKTYSSLVELTADICKRHGFNPIMDIHRHYDVTGKSCPMYYVKNESAWIDFIMAVNMKIEPVGTQIMGEPVLTAEELAAYLLSKNPDPKINCCVSALAAFFIYEGKVEGVRGDIAFCQSCHETGWFKFGNQVLPEQNNYCGIGAVNNSAVGKGAWFDTPQTGVRAQIQHLKAYASKEPLKNECVDPRFNLVTRGSAPCWEDLNGKWAVPGTTYGQGILKLYEGCPRIKPDKNTPESVVKRLNAAGVTADTDYWLNVLNGKRAAEPGNLLTVFDRLLSKAGV